MLFRSEVAACTCDRCQRRMTPDDPDLGFQEKLSIAYRSGFGSIFGDGCDISIDLCQQCVKETIGTWLRIASGDDFAADWAAPGSIEALKGIVSKPENPVSVEDMIPATDRLRGTVLRYDDPTDPVWPADDES